MSHWRRRYRNAFVTAPGPGSEHRCCLGQLGAGNFSKSRRTVPAPALCYGLCVSQGRLLVLGNLKGSALAALETARRDTGYDATILARADDAIHELDRPQLRALVVDLTTPGAARFCQEARARRALFNVPLIALSPKLTELAFSNAQRWGADDVVALGAAEALAARLEFIPEIAAPLAMATRGEAVIADTDRGRCDVLGRVLANAGFNVKYATDPVATRFYLNKNNVKLFVLNTELGDPATMIAEARAAGNPADWVVTTKTLAVDALREELSRSERVIVMPSHGPPENALFAINLLQPSSDAQRRTELRALHAAVVVFRALSWDHDEHGFTYSVSAGGLYLRTLVRPPKERVWLELTPPNVPRKVKLLAEVAWSRTFGQPGAETAPPGFGVRIVDGQGDDLTLWRQGFESLDIKSPAAAGMPELRPSTTSFRIPLPAQAATVRANSLAPVGGAMRPNSMSPNSMSPNRSSTNLSRVGRSLAPAGDTATGRSLEVVVPSSTWSAPEYTPRPPSVELPRPPSTSSQAAVLAALRTSLLPNAPMSPEFAAANPVIREAHPAPPPEATQPIQLPWADSPLGQPGFEDTLHTDLPPIKLDPSALLDPAADLAVLGGHSGGRVVRTVLGMGGLQPALGSFTPAPPPPLTLEQLGVEAAPNPAHLAMTASKSGTSNNSTPYGGTSTSGTSTNSTDTGRTDTGVAATPDGSGEFLPDGEIASIPPAPLESSRRGEALDSMVGAPHERGGPAPEEHGPFGQPSAATGPLNQTGQFDKTEPDLRAVVLDEDELPRAGTVDASLSKTMTSKVSPEVTPNGAEVTPDAGQVRTKAGEDTTKTGHGAGDTLAKRAPPRAGSSTLSSAVGSAVEPAPRATPEPGGNDSEARRSSGRLTPPPRKSRRSEGSQEPRWQDETAPATSGTRDSLAAVVPPRKSKGGWIAGAVAVVGVLVLAQVYMRFGSGSSKATAELRNPPARAASTPAPVAPAPVALAPVAPASAAQVTRALPTDTPSPPADDPALNAAGAHAPAPPTEPLAAHAPPAEPTADGAERSAEGAVEPPAGNEPQAAPNEEPGEVPQPETTSVTRSPAPPAPDTLSLSEDTAWLYVHSSVSSRVFVHGVDHGATNEWLRSRCGGRFIRLGTSPGAWLSAGVPTKLRCRQANEIEVNPSE
jgi:hypothetical protein